MKKNMLLIPLALLLAISLVASGCPAPTPTAPPEVAELQREITKLKADLAEARAKEAVEPEYSWRFGVQMPAGTIYATGPEMFASLVHEYSDGRIEITVYPGAVLGGIMETWEAVQAGDLELGYTFPYGSIHPKFDAALMPFLQSNYEQLKHLHTRAYDGIIYRIISSTLEEVGLKYMTISFFSMIGFNTVKPVRTPTDFAGLKIRVYGAMLIESVARMGGLPTTLPPEELYTAMQTGVIDGMIGHARYAMDLRTFEIAKYVDSINFYGCAGADTMNLELYNSLPDDLREVIDRAAFEAEQWMVEEDLLNAWEAEVEFEKYGGTIARLTDEERQAFIDLVKPEELWREYMTDVLGPDLLEEVIAESARIRALY